MSHSHLVRMSSQYFAPGNSVGKSLDAGNRKGYRISAAWSGSGGETHLHKASAVFILCAKALLKFAFLFRGPTVLLLFYSQRLKGSSFEKKKTYLDAGGETSVLKNFRWFGSVVIFIMFNTDKVAMASKLEILSKKMEEILKSCTIS